MVSILLGHIHDRVQLTVVWYILIGGVDLVRLVFQLVSDKWISAEMLG